jgi:hypothetical protein
LFEGVVFVIFVVQNQMVPLMTAKSLEHAKNKTKKKQQQKKTCKKKVKEQR